MYYIDIFKAFFLDEIKYLVVGGLAVNLHGIPRVTQDVDIIISLDEENVKKLINTLSSINYIPRLPVKALDLANSEKRQNWISNKNLKAFSFYNKSDNFKVIDIILSHPLKFEDAFRTRIIKKVKSFEIYLVSIKNLIRMKKASGREQDKSDIILLKKVIKWEEEDK